MKEYIKEIKQGVPLYRDSRTGIAWAEDHRTGLGVSVHPNIDESGGVEGMVARGWWRRDDRVEKATAGSTTSTGWPAMQMTLLKRPSLMPACAELAGNAESTLGGRAI